MAAGTQNKLHRRPTNYNITRDQAATMPTPWRRSQGHETAIRRNSAAQRITMLTAPTSKTSCTHPRPASMCAPRGGHRYNPRPGPRRHHLTHAAGMGHTSPQRRHQHKARAMYHAHGPQPPHIIRHKPKPPCHVSIYDTKQGGFIFFIVAKIKSGPNGIRALRHQSASAQVGSMSASDLCP